MTHDTYNTKNYPSFVAHHGNWDIYMNDKGQSAAIPTKEAARIGCQATHFGDFHYTRRALADGTLIASLTPNRR